MRCPVLIWDMVLPGSKKRRAASGAEAAGTIAPVQTCTYRPTIPVQTCMEPWYRHEHAPTQPLGAVRH
eukprot:2634438-Rhodomonas_salina.1